MYCGHFNKTKLYPPQSTQCQPLSSTNFLHELDHVTKEIVSAILEEQKTGLAVEGDEIVVPGTKERFTLAKRVNLAELSRARRQFVSYAKARAIDDVSKLASMFVQYLNSNLGGGSGAGDAEET
jgi:protein KTI12